MSEFIDFSSVFKTIIQQKLVTKLNLLAFTPYRVIRLFCHQYKILNTQPRVMYISISGRIGFI